MKKIVFFVTGILLLLVGCTGTGVVHVQNDGLVTMKTALIARTDIQLSGTGTVTIDWGDGKSDSNTLLGTDSVNEYKHEYESSSYDGYTITITGKNVTTLICNAVLTSLDVSKNTALTKLDCSNNALDSLDVSNNFALNFLNCGANQLESLDVSKNIALTYLNCNRNQLMKLDVSKSIALMELICYNNQLKSLNVSNNPALKVLDCAGNQLSNLDLSKNATLTNLDCSGNQLTDLDVSKNITLTKLSCNLNKLTSLDLSSNIALTYLNCNNNKFPVASLNKLFSTLNDKSIDNKTKTILIDDYSDTTICDRSIAEKKGWKVEASGD